MKFWFSHVCRKQFWEPVTSCRRQFYPICPFGVEGGSYDNIMLYLSFTLWNTWLYWKAKPIISSVSVSCIWQILEANKNRKESVCDVFWQWIERASINFVSLKYPLPPWKLVRKMMMKILWGVCWEKVLGCWMWGTGYEVENHRILYRR